MAVLCREQTLEETMVQICAEVCTCCPTLNAAQIAGCGTAFLVMVGTLLGPPPPVVEVTTTNSRRKMRHPDFHLKKKTTRRTTTPAYASLRAVHAPGVTPVVLGPRSTAASSRGETHARLVTRAVINEKLSDELVMRTLQETPRIGLQHAVGIPGEHTQVLMGLLAGAVGLVLLGKVVHKVLGRIGHSRVGTGTAGAKRPTLEENRANLERIFQTGEPFHNSGKSLQTYIKLASEVKTDTVSHCEQDPKLT